MRPHSSVSGSSQLVYGGMAAIIADDKAPTAAPAELAETSWPWSPRSTIPSPATASPFCAAPGCAWANCWILEGPFRWTYDGVP